MPSPDDTCVRILAVDACLLDYTRLAQFARRAGMRFDQLSSGQDALRAGLGMTVDLWIINLALPDMSGFALVEQLQPRARGSDVFLVADSYRAEDELQALALGVTLYLCKPPRAAWLSHWRPRRNEAEAPGAGPCVESVPHQQLGEEMTLVNFELRRRQAR